MIQTQPVKRNLRPRRKVLPPGLPSTPKTSYVTKMTVTVERNGELSKHELFFDKEPLSLREMYSVGFLGDLEFRHNGGLLEKAELEAGPAGEFEGVVVGRFAFRITYPDSNRPFGAKVVKFNFYRS